MTGPSQPPPGPTTPPRKVAQAPRIEDAYTSRPYSVVAATYGFDDAVRAATRYAGT